LLIPLSIKQVPIDVEKVCEGMYVSKLDRPWLETPFIFQGFEIREQAEIDMLQRYCSVVYIDAEKGTLTNDQVRRLMQVQRQAGKPPRQAAPRKAKEPGRFLRSLQKLLIRLGFYRHAATLGSSGQEGYRIQTTVRAEADAARDAYKVLARQHKQIMDRATLRGNVLMAEVQQAVQPAIDSILRNPNALAWTVFSRKRSSENYNRTVGTAIWCLMFGRHLNFDRAMLEELAMGGMLLDIGNSMLPKSIAATAGVISEEQKGMLRQHVKFGVQILAQSQGVPQAVADMVGCHHERFDGSGYPRGLYGNQIPPFGRIAGIADCYDAMTSETPYSKPMAAYDAARALNEMRGKEFAAEVVEQFIATMGMFPVASLVELNDGSVAVVLEQNPGNVLRPKVLVLLDENRAPLPQPKLLEMRELPLDATHSNAKWIVGGHEHGAFGIDPADIFS
jgi:HD-GYP domain-containing protein (c-di-GMP phosphodiesterase class II)